MIDARGGRGQGPGARGQGGKKTSSFHPPWPLAPVPVTSGRRKDKTVTWERGDPGNTCRCLTAFLQHMPKESRVSQLASVATPKEIEPYEPPKPVFENSPTFQMACR